MINNDNNGAHHPNYSRDQRDLKRLRKNNCLNIAAIVGQSKKETSYLMN